MIKFISGKPALIIEKSLVVSDLHIGLEEKLEEKGINVGNLSYSMGLEVKRLFDSSGAEKLILLGDVKESISYPTKQGYSSLRSFFEQLKGIDVTIVKGNHDAHIKEVMSIIGFECNIVKELILKEAALIHGHAYPSKEALKKKYLIIGHGHAAYGPLGGSLEKVWIIAKSRKNKRLVLLPAFNPMITGSNIANWDSDIGIFRSGSFDIYSAKVFDLEGRLIGTIKELSKQG
jgi:putative SbcD/Mre11-related phosphoesterase